MSLAKILKSFLSGPDSYAVAIKTFEQDIAYATRQITKDLSLLKGKLKAEYRNAEIFEVVQTQSAPGQVEGHLIYALGLRREGSLTQDHFLHVELTFNFALNRELKRFIVKKIKINVNGSRVLGPAGDVPELWTVVLQKIGELRMQLARRFGIKEKEIQVQLPRGQK